MLAAPSYRLAHRALAMAVDVRAVISAPSPQTVKLYERAEPSPSIRDLAFARISSQYLEDSIFLQTYFATLKEECVRLASPLAR